eukprot:6193305-Pleurochrysis_carterae.AAC.2
MVAMLALAAVAAAYTFPNAAAMHTARLNSGGASPNELVFSSSRTAALHAIRAGASAVSLKARP